MLDAGVYPFLIARQLDVSKSLVDKVRKLKREGITIVPKTSPGRPLKRTPQLLKLVQETYEADPMVSYVVTAKKLGVSRTTVSNAVADLGMKQYVQRVRALVSAKSKKKRIERASELLEWLDENPDTGTR